MTQCHVEQNLCWWFTRWHRVRSKYRVKLLLGKREPSSFAVETGFDLHLDVLQPCVGYSFQCKTCLSTRDLHLMNRKHGTWSMQHSPHRPPCLFVDCSDQIHWSSVFSPQEPRPSWFRLFWVWKGRLDCSWEKEVSRESAASVVAAVFPGLPPIGGNLPRPSDQPSQAAPMGCTDGALENVLEHNIAF